MERKVCAQWINFDMTKNEMNEANLDFLEKAGLPDVIGSVGGTHIKIIAPNKED
ncbi:hypothetical protein DOY81_012990 [Sarcophaga bullata]|nr:hypothetical protein DOY81_012990 [Sarcophaga bullata]